MLMLVQLSSKDGLLEAAVKARKKPFMAAVVIVGHFKHFLSFYSLASRSNYYIWQSIGLVQVKNNNNGLCPNGRVMSEWSIFLNIYFCER